MDKLKKKQYEFVCEMIWGSVPLDRAWVEKTPFFQQRWFKILQKYPNLNKDIKPTKLLRLKIWLYKYCRFLFKFIVYLDNKLEKLIWK